ncbi:activating signal cointegrator 1 complex subunit 2 homolog [Physella acuta]|uniref:activating signal cointegrator 1 complex subunit 2 homolog n=1 Tax=Physella acuta TaxID=109671 RepID=UPI0027DB6621|nr:activating signal cointegrator 1 complex subunit 2 homolog [Physella acuta]
MFGMWTSHRTMLASIALVILVAHVSTVLAFSDGSKLAKGLSATRSVYCHRSTNKRQPLHFNTQCNGYCAPNLQGELYYTLSVSAPSYWLDIITINITAKDDTDRSVTGFSIYAVDESQKVAGSFVEDDNHILVGSCGDVLAYNQETHGAFHKMADRNRKNISFKFQPDGFNHGAISFVAWVVNNHSDIHYLESELLLPSKNGSYSLDVESVLENLVDEIDMKAYDESFDYRAKMGYHLDQENPFANFESDPDVVELVPVKSSKGNLTPGNMTALNVNVTDDNVTSESPTVSMAHTKESKQLSMNSIDTPNNMNDADSVFGPDLWLPHNDEWTKVYGNGDTNPKFKALLRSFNTDNAQLDSNPRPAPQYYTQNAAPQASNENTASGSYYPNTEPLHTDHGSSYQHDNQNTIPTDTSNSQAKPHPNVLSESFESYPGGDILDTSPHYPNPNSQYPDSNSFYPDPYYDTVLGYPDPNPNYPDPQQEYPDPKPQYPDPNSLYPDPKQEYPDPKPQFDPTPQYPNPLYPDPKQEYPDPKPQYLYPKPQYPNPKPQYPNQEEPYYGQQPPKFKEQQSTIGGDVNSSIPQSFNQQYPKPTTQDGGQDHLPVQNLMY